MMEKQLWPPKNKSTTSFSWKPINDSVMGGLSESTAVVQNGVLHFSGDVSLENNGGFAMIQSEIEPIPTKDFNCFKLRVKGDGKRYQFRVKECVDQRYSYIHHFQTTTDWHTILIPFKSLKPWFRGNQLKMDDFQGPNVNSLSFLIANRKAESFNLEVESIWLVS